MYTFFLKSGDIVNGRVERTNADKKKEIGIGVNEVICVCVFVKGRCDSNIHGQKRQKGKKKRGKRLSVCMCM